MPHYLANLTAGQLDGLRALAAETGRPVAAFVREAVTCYLSGQQLCTVAVGSGLLASGAVLTLQEARS